MKKEFLVFVVWFAIVSVPISILMAQHNLPFSIDVKTPSQIIKTLSDKDHLSVTHILSAKCKCSKRVGRHLEETLRPEFLQETIVIVDGTLPNETELSKKGFKLSHISVADLKTQFNLEAAPVLLVSDSSGELKYSGGYKNIDEMDHRDLEIVSEVKGGSKVVALPVLGCALSPALKTAMDPFKLKYKN